jgi:hypothetical protein
MLNKRADIGLGVIIVILIIVVFLGWLVNEGWKECRVDSDCKTNQYCTSQFECKDIPVIEKVSPQNVNYNSVAWIIGLCLVAAALNLKWDSIFPKKEAPKSNPQKTKANPQKKEEYLDLSYGAEESEDNFEKDFQKE